MAHPRAPAFAVMLAFAHPAAAQLGRGAPNPDPAHVDAADRGHILLTPIPPPDPVPWAWAGDSLNMQWALNNVDIGGVVELAEGDFHAGRWVTTTNFDGTLKGAANGLPGGRTRIHVVEGFAFEPGQQPSVFRFKHSSAWQETGSLTVSDFSVSVAAGVHTQPWVWNGGTHTVMGYAVVVGGGPFRPFAPNKRVRARLERLEAEGAASTAAEAPFLGGWSNFYFPIGISWLKGDVTVTDYASTRTGFAVGEYGMFDSTFQLDHHVDHASHTGLITEEASTPQAATGGTTVTMKNCRYTDTRRGFAAYFPPASSRLLVQDNVMTNLSFYGVLGVNPNWSALVSGNDFQGSNAVGVAIWGNGTGWRVTHNTVHDSRIGIWADWGLQTDAAAATVRLLPAVASSFRNNDLSGNRTGIHFGAFARDNEALGNNVTRSSYAGYFLSGAETIALSARNGPQPTAPLTFGPASGNRIVGGSLAGETLVIDDSGCQEGACPQVDRDGDGRIAEDGIDGLDDDGDLVDFNGNGLLDAADWLLVDEAPVDVPNSITGAQVTPRALLRDTDQDGIADMLERRAAAIARGGLEPLDP